MATHIPKWHRGYSKPIGYLTPTIYKDTVVSLYASPYEEQSYKKVWTTNSAQPIGTVTTTVVKAGMTQTRHTYDLLQHIRREHSCPFDSSYKATILIGNYVGRDQEQDLFGNLEAPRTNLWCGRCWHDNMYGTGEGGVEIPQRMLGRYFGYIHHLPTCHFCDAKFYTQQAIQLGPLETRSPPATSPAPPVAPIFSAIGSADLKAEVNRQLAPFGYGEIECYGRRAHLMGEEFRQEVVREAMKPCRVAAILAKHDYAGLEASF